MKLNIEDKKYKTPNTREKQTEIKLKITTNPKPIKCLTACTKSDSLSESFLKIRLDSKANKSNNKYTDITI